MTEVAASIAVQQRLGSGIFALLGACGSSRDLQSAERVHAIVIRAGIEQGILVANSIVSMYGKCGSPENARRVFDTLQWPDLVSWNCLILGYAENGQEETALEMLFRMEEYGCAPDSRSFVAGLRACVNLARKEDWNSGTKLKSLEKAKLVHGYAASLGAHRNDFVGSSLVDLYAKCGSMADSRRVFDAMAHPTAVAWNSLLAGYVYNGEEKEALEMFQLLRRVGRPDALAFAAALRACSGLGAKGNKLDALSKGMAIHSDAEKNGFEPNLVLSNILVDMYAKCGSMVDSSRLFYKMPFRDLVSWNSLILGYVENQEAELALSLFTVMMRLQIRSDSRTLVAALKACGILASKEKLKELGNEKMVKVEALEKGMFFHSIAAKAGDFNSFVGNTLVDFYAKCGSMVDSQRVFDGMKHRDVRSWTALILGYVENGDEQQALQAFELQDCPVDALSFVAALKACSGLAVKVLKPEDRAQVLEKGMAVHSYARKDGYGSNWLIVSTLVDMYSSLGSMVDAKRAFDGIELVRHDVVSWNALILAYIDNGESEIALEYFADLRSRSITTNASTLAVALKACGSLTELATGKSIHGDILRCARTLDATYVFDSFPTNETVTWNALMVGYSRAGQTDSLLDAFDRMQQQSVNPDSVTLLLALNACSHAGLVDAGSEIFRSMGSKFKLEPRLEHYHCLIDLLGRGNQVNRAIEVALSMPYEPNGLTWRIILSACSKVADLAVARSTFQSLLQRGDEVQGSDYSLMANVLQPRGGEDG
ncbi:pentatricopeptide repeat-containing protein At5g27110-like isoform X1 [Selaginella moellendorffii]|uniref:pentatricopeptide repeat-containing protein At5g27110-like isoform X1 n=1 Tax=Selaginella moellendorffii TaxID=88036 RepID=UPI000D1C3381|nr:pentatricopeptide repeat-containing protein At5g27110-like isoform X1 [Selaginella moellendorffii]|eukprot:XP_024523974.1 pentatricopeptide repeat-containing protein At5g27110-like isoform X1 [Selaginella moellendorffii]